MLTFRPWKRLHRAVMRQKLVGCGGILLYHRIVELARDPWSLAISPARFDEQLAVLGREALCLPLATFLARRAAGTLPRHAVSLTFDDGYADNLHEALPILERHGVPATVFVTTGFIDSCEEPWWDRLAQVVDRVAALPDHLELVIDGKPFSWVKPRLASDSGARGSLAAAVARTLAACETAVREAVLADLWQQLGTWPRHRESHRGLTLEELQRLAASPLITIGAHTRTHPRLAEISPVSQYAELAGSKAELEAWLHRPVELIAYPHGSMSRMTVDLAREAGFTWGLTSTKRIVPHRCERLRLPRLEVEDVDGETLPKFLQLYGIRKPRGSGIRAAAPARGPGATSVN